MRLVIDTNELLSAAMSSASPPAQLFALWRSRKFDLLTCAEQIDEIARITRYPKIRTRLAPALAGRLINRIRDLAIVVEKLPKVDRSPDPGDNYLLALAEAGEKNDGRRVPENHRVREAYGDERIAHRARVGPVGNAFELLPTKRKIVLDIVGAFGIKRPLFIWHIEHVQFPARDHCAPGTGTIDFAALKPFVKPEHIKVFELSPSLPVEAVKSGIAHLKLIWGNE